MSCFFPCFRNKEEEEDVGKDQQLLVAQPPPLQGSSSPQATPTTFPNKECSPTTPPPEITPPSPVAASNKAVVSKGGTEESGNPNAKTFTFRELASATKNFRQECLIDEGGFGKVFKGTLQNEKVVTVKRLDRTGARDSKDFSVEVLVLTLLQHPNLLNLIGYCADGEQRLLVYEYMPMGCLQDHLFDLTDDKKPLNWLTRMKIASGVAQGLEYLHEKANPPIIYRDLKSSTILLDQDFNPKLSDYGLAKLEGRGSNTLLTPGIMGTGYCAPEYERTGELTLKCDVYSFGVVLVELISGRRAVDPARPLDQQNLVEWARPIFRDPKRFPEMADPLLKRAFPMTSLNQAVGVAAMCLQEEASVRPLFGDVVAALSFLAVASTDEPPIPTAPLEDTVRPSPDDHDGEASDRDSDDQSSDSSSSSSSDHSDNEDEEEETELQRGKSPRITNKTSSSIRSNTSSSSSDDDDSGKNDYFPRRTSNSEKPSHETDSIDFRNGRISYTDEASGDLSSNEDLSSRPIIDAEKAPQESDSINSRDDGNSDPDEDGGDLSFCYSVSASENLKSNSSVRESADEGDPMKKSIMKSENQSFGSYSTSSDEGSDEEEEERSWR